MANTLGEKELSRKYPVVSGLGVDDRHDGRVISLVAEKGSLVMHKRC